MYKKYWRKKKKKKRGTIITKSLRSPKKKQRKIVSNNVQMLCQLSHNKNKGHSRLEIVEITTNKFVYNDLSGCEEYTINATS